MNDIEKTIAQDFIVSLDSIAVDFIRCFGLKHSQKIGNLSEPLLRWLDFRLRYIDPKPRKVLLSKKFPKKLTTETRDSLIQLIAHIQHGDNVNPYQGKGLIYYHDISGQKRQQRTDLLWADWGITHLHLTNKPISDGEYFSGRSKWILFALAGDDYFACIDVRRHEEIDVFSNPALVQTVAESWPELISNLEAKGIVPPAPMDMLSAQDYVKLRQGGVTSFITIGNKVYMPPGLGVTTASTPFRVTWTMDHARGGIRDLAHLVCDIDGEFQSSIRTSEIREPNFQLRVTEKGLAIFEQNLNKAWLLPRRAPGGSGPNYLADLHDLVAPEWAIKQLLRPDNV